VWRRRRIGSLVGWLEAAMTEAEGREAANAEEPESRQRRLETDAAAVQVQTVHAAKGLQWPVVLVPYAWDVWVSKPSIPVFHADATGGGARARRIDVGGPDAPEFADHVARAMAEDAGEEGRLLYVALTRAEHHLQTWWIEGVERTADSKLHELVTAAGRTPDDLVAASGGTVAMPVLTALPAVEHYRPQEPAPATLERARFTRRLDHWWRRASFSSLSPIHPLDAGAETAEAAPKADEVVPEPVADEALVPVGVSVLAMADLPRGARFGTLLHEVIEQVPFDAPDVEASVRAALAPQLEVGGWDFDPDAFVAAVGAALTTPLGPEPDAARLVDLDPARTFAELSFELPVRTERGTVSLADIGRIMGEHLAASDPYRGYAATLAGFPETRFRGYLTGAVDLTAVMPNLGGGEGPVGDRYVVVDYKSNALPMLGEVASPLDYGPGPLAGAMVDGNYVLQATLYQVALHRYLQWRLAGYDPQRHLGGAMYLFVRGMAGPDAPVVEGERCGVVRWRPPVAMIVALSALFKGDMP
jgi:exodeoxyribonuclease V beta subunit